MATIEHMRAAEYARRNRGSMNKWLDSSQNVGYETSRHALRAVHGDGLAILQKNRGCMQVVFRTRNGFPVYLLSVCENATCVSCFILTLIMWIIGKFQLLRTTFSLPSRPYVCSMIGPPSPRVLFHSIVTLFTCDLYSAIAVQCI